MEWEEARIKINGEYLNDFRFPDNIVSMSESTGELQQMVKMNMKRT